MTTWDAENPIVPFDKQGNMMDYADYRLAEWKLVLPFQASMRVVDMERGRSAARFILQSTTGIRYPVFMTDMLDIMMKEEIKYGYIPRATWKAVKRGQNYGLALKN